MKLNDLGLNAQAQAELDAVCIAHDEHIMTVAELIYQLEQIKDNSTPVYLESGQPVHYTTFGMNQNETRFFIGVM
jgi:hypothetical protein